MLDAFFAFAGSPLFSSVTHLGGGGVAVIVAILSEDKECVYSVD
jgi:hypothetical protein